MTANLPARYEALAERNPKLRVAFLAYGRTRTDMWYRMGPLADDEAAALITTKLLAELPKVSALEHMGAGWSVRREMQSRGWHGFHDTPLLALLAYWESQP